MSARASALNRAPSRLLTPSLGSNTTNGSSSGEGRRIDEPCRNCEKTGCTIRRTEEESIPPQMVLLDGIVHNVDFFRPHYLTSNKVNRFR